MLEKALNYIYTSTDGLLSSFFIGYALKTACLLLVNTILSFALLSPVSTLPFLNLYFLYLTMMLPKARKNSSESKFQILSVIPHLVRKLFNFRNKVSSFINSTFSGALATLFIIYFQGSFLLAAPVFAGLLLTYLAISAYCGSEIADTLFDVRVIVLSVLTGFAISLLSGLSHQIFLGIYALVTIAGYIHLNEANQSNAKYGLDSILMLVMTLISPITTACRYVGFMLPVVEVMESGVAKLIQTCSCILIAGHAAKSTFDSPVEKDAHEVLEPKGSWGDANPRIIKKAAAAA